MLPLHSVMRRAWSKPIPSFIIVPNQPNDNTYQQSEYIMNNSTSKCVSLISLDYFSGWIDRLRCNNYNLWASAGYFATKNVWRCACIFIVIFICFQIDFVQRPSWQAMIAGKKSWRIIPSPECESTCHEMNATMEKGDISKWSVVKIN